MTKLSLALLVGLIIGLAGRFDLDSKIVEEKVAAESPRPFVEPLFYEPVFDPSKPRRQRACDAVERQFICERGPDQEWSCICVDFQQAPL